MRRGRYAACAAAALTVLPALWTGHPAAAAGATDPLLAALRSDQAAVIKADSAPAIHRAQAAITSARTALATDRSDLGTDLGALRTDQAAAATVVGRSSADESAQAAAATTATTAQARLTSDRSRLRALAVDLYVNSDSGGLPQSQDTMFSQSEAVEVATTVVRSLHQDVAAASRDATVLAARTATVDDDHLQLIADDQHATQATARAAGDHTKAAAASARLTASTHQLAVLTAAEKKAVAAVAGPASATNGLTVLGPAILTAAQLTAWYEWSGYADLTSTGINQLAGWYVQEGRQVGVRGDVAFAQAILETGGFSSPDSVDLNNYAGIGHCDSCAAGWKFPSAQGGVLGQLQLLHIFAGTPAGAGVQTANVPPPVLPALTPANEGVHGCCNTWESLTGVWATDPTYGSQILGIYDQILQYTLSTTVSS